MEGRGEAFENADFIQQLERLVERGDTDTLTARIDEMEGILGDLEAHGGLPSAIATVRTRKELAEAARERVWMKQAGDKIA